MKRKRQKIKASEKEGLLCALKNDRGNAIVEAVIVLPVVILAVVSVIMLTTFLSGAVFNSVDAHRALRSEEGISSGTRVTYYDKAEHADISEEYKGGRKLMRTDILTQIDKGFLLENKIVNNREARVYVIDEKKTTRYMDLLEEIVY